MARSTQLTPSGFTERPYINVLIVRANATATTFQQHGWKDAVERAIRIAEDDTYGKAAGPIFMHDCNTEGCGLETHTLVHLKADLAAGRIPE